LNFGEIFSKHKKNGVDISKLFQAIISYRLNENFSIKRAHEWINREEVLERFDLQPFSERTLYRVLETIGANREEIISDIQDILFERYDFEHTDINMDWTSIVLHGTEAKLGNTETKGFNATMKRGVRGHPIGIRDILRNARISRIRSPGERPYAVIKNVFHSTHTRVTTVLRVHTKMVFSAFSINLYQLATLKKQGVLERMLSIKSWTVTKIQDLGIVDSQSAFC